MAVLLPGSPRSFVLVTVLYALLLGAEVSLFDELTLTLTRDSPVAATIMAAFASALYIGATYMTLADGFACKLAGVRGLYLMDGLPSLVGGLLFLWFSKVRAHAAR